jgi:phosphate transport system substrate-binding protein
VKKFKRVVFLVPSVLLIFFLSGCQQLNQESLTVAGSTAIQPIIEMAAAKYRQQRPNSYVNVQGGGSETGLSQVAERAIDIGTSDVFASQKASLQVHKLQDHKLAVSGIAS